MPHSVSLELNLAFLPVPSLCARGRLGCGVSVVTCEQGRPALSSPLPSPPPPAEARRSPRSDTEVLRHGPSLDALVLGRLGSISTCLPVSPSTPGVTSSPRQPGLGPWEAEAGRTSCLRHCPAAAGEGERWGVRPAPTAPHEEADLARSSRGPVPSLRVLAAPLSLAESLPFSAWLTPRQGCVGVPWRPAGPRPAPAPSSSGPWQAPAVELPF